MANDPAALPFCYCNRGFLQLAPRQRTQAVDVLAANLRYVCTSAQQLLADGETPCPETLQRHRNAIKMIVHLLHVVSMQAQKDAETAKGAENAAAKPAKATGTLNTLQHINLPHYSCPGFLL